MTLNGITFNLMSDEEIRRDAVVEIKFPKEDAKKNYKQTLQDARMGPMYHHGEQKCITCNQKAVVCGGHFGYLNLNTPVIHPLFSAEISSLLKSFCYFCFSLLQDKTSSSPVCALCGHEQPVWTLFEMHAIADWSTKIKKQVTYQANDIRAFFMQLNKNDLKKIKTTQVPENFIFECLRILPPCARPSVSAEGKVCEDDLTNQYQEIIKANINIIKARDKDPKDLQDAKLSLFSKISVFMINSNGKKKTPSSSNKVIKGIKDRINKKTGLVRFNVIAKRTEKSGRTVIGPEPTLLMDQVVVPRKMANILTIPERVSHLNISYLKELHAKGRINTIKRNGDILSTVYGNNELKIGDEVERFFQDGDYSLINRQPTLHEGGMLAMRAVIRDTKTICFNLCNTKIMNADFDGDEGNIHVPQSYASIAELDTISCVKNMILSSQNGQANITLVQDNVLALYLMTTEDFILPIEDSNDLLLRLVGENGREWPLHKIIERRDILRNSFEEGSGRFFISMCLPSDFDWSFGKEDVCIFKGCFVTGICTKKVVQSLIAAVVHVYNNDVAAMMINNLQFVTNGWLSHRGFSIGLEDCITSTPRSAIEEIIEKYQREADLLAQTIQDENIKELRIQGALNKARDSGMKETIQGFKKDNNLLLTVKSGSKGDYFNIAQITGLLGQQFFKGKRIEPALDGGRKSLYHDQNNIYEERGFISGCFLDGLSAQEAFFHAIAGRSGVVDTAMGTGETGYMQRQIIKMMEDIHTETDQTVRDELGNICQFYYGVGLDVVNPLNHIRDIAEKFNNRHTLRDYQ